MALPATDDFNTDEDPLTGSANWAATGTDANANFKSDFNQLRLDDSTNDNAIYWLADSFNANQYGEIKFVQDTTSTNKRMGIILRAGSGDQALLVRYRTNTSLDFECYYWPSGGGSRVTIGSSYAPSTPFADGDTMRVEVSGEVISLFIDIGSTGTFGSVETTWNVPAPAQGLTGAPGVYMVSDSTTTRGDDFEGGNLSAPDTTAPILTSPTGVKDGSLAYTGGVSTDEGNGTLYWLVDQNTTATDVAIKAADSQAVSGTGTQPVSGAGLTANTTYYIHFLHSDAAANDSTSVNSASFTTDAASLTVTGPAAVVDAATAVDVEGIEFSSAAVDIQIKDDASTAVVQAITSQTSTAITLTAIRNVITEPTLGSPQDGVPYTVLDDSAAGITAYALEWLVTNGDTSTDSNDVTLASASTQQTIQAMTTGVDAAITTVGSVFHTTLITVTDNMQATIDKTNGGVTYTLTANGLLVHDSDVQENVGITYYDKITEQLSFATLTLEALGPALTLPTEASITETTLTVGCTTDNGAGTLYYYISLSASPPSVSDLKDGTGAIKFDNDASISVGINTFAVTGLTADTDYFTYFIQNDGSNDSGILRSNAWATLDTTAPVLSSPVGVKDSDDSYTGTVSTDEANGTLYHLVDQNTTATDGAIKAGPSQAVSGTGSQAVSGSGLTPSTTYYIHYLHRDAAGNDSTSVNSPSFITDATPDDTAPILSTPIGVKDGITAFTGSVITDEGNGTLYYLVDQNATASDSAIKAAASQAVAFAGTHNVSGSGLSASTTYYIHYLHSDTTGNDSISVNSASFTTDTPDTDPPIFSVAPRATLITTTGGTATATIDETGDIFYVVVLASDTPPTVQEVLDLEASGGGAPLDSGSVLANTILSDEFTNLDASTNYTAYFVAQDDEGTPNVQVAVTDVDFTTTAAAPDSAPFLGSGGSVSVVGSFIN